LSRRIRACGWSRSREPEPLGRWPVGEIEVLLSSLEEKTPIAQLTAATPGEWLFRVQDRVALDVAMAKPDSEPLEESRRLDTKQLNRNDGKALDAVSKDLVTRAPIGVR
jgi:hypothetical protein